MHMRTRTCRRPIRRAWPSSFSASSATARPGSSSSRSSASSPASKTSRPATPDVIRPTVARVDLGALKSNYRRIVEFLGAEPRARGRSAPGVIAVVKANAYGHGAGQVACALEDAGADLLACADIEEGAVLRAAGVKAEILVFGALSISERVGLFDSNRPPTISTSGAARESQAASVKAKKPLQYHLRTD